MSEARQTASYLAVEVIQGETASEVQQAVNDWLDQNLAREVRNLQLTAGPSGLAVLITYARERRVRRS